MKLLGIHHIAILTDDYETSKKFYTELLGFKVVAETYRGTRDSWKLNLALDDRYMIELFSFPDFRERASFPEAKGLRHLAFSVEDVTEARSFLLANGVEKVEEIRVDELTGKKFLFFYDPNGQPLELYET